MSGNPVHPPLREDDARHYACAQPERPFSSRTVVSTGCPACVLAARAALRVQGDLSATSGESPYVLGTHTSLSAVLRQLGEVAG